MDGGGVEDPLYLKWPEESGGQLSRVHLERQVLRRVLIAKSLTHSKAENFTTRWILGKPDHVTNKAV